MKKELRPVHDPVSCDVCGRTMLKGERAEAFLAPGNQRHQVCELCFVRAAQGGWIRESVAGDVPTRPPREDGRRSLLGRLRGRGRDSGTASRPAPPERSEPEAEAWEVSEQETPDEALPQAPRSRPKDPRHVRAVPTTAEVKVERALELFNGSDHQRTVAGLTRTLGEPLVSAQPDAGQASAVSVVVAWELSWYRYRVDLGDEADPVMMLEKGEEIEEIDESLRAWNAKLDGSGRVLAGQALDEGGSER